METKTSVVTKTLYKKSYIGQFGEMFVHEIEFENGDSGEYHCKNRGQEKFLIGKETPYTRDEIKKGQYTNISIKPIQEQKQWGNGGGNFSGGGAKRSGNESFALSYSKDILIASWTGAKAPKAVLTEEMFKLADKMYVWLESKKPIPVAPPAVPPAASPAPAPKPEAKPTPQPQPEEPPISLQVYPDDLPF